MQTRKKHKSGTRKPASEIDVQLNPVWLHAGVGKWTLTCVSSHFPPWPEATQGQPERQFTLVAE